MVPARLSPAATGLARRTGPLLVLIAAACAGGNGAPPVADAAPAPVPAPPPPGATPDYALVTDSTLAPDDRSAVWMVRAVSRRPQMLRAVPLVYPDSLRRGGVGGDVVVEFVVDTLGRVERGVRVVQAAHPGLAEPARQTVRQARFRPGHARGRPVRVLMTLRFHYEPKRS